MKAVTLGDVARVAEVHKATAARALNRDPRISAPTRQKVEQAAQALGYRVNHLLAAWMSTRLKRVPVANAVLAYVTGHPTRYGWRPTATADWSARWVRSRSAMCSVGASQGVGRRKGSGCGY